MTETNPFRYFLPSTPQKLIIGSFPCYNGTGYGDWFYSGSGKNLFWLLLSDLMQMPAANKEEKAALCETHHIALTDIAFKIERKLCNCSDANLRIIEFNRAGIDKCLASGITSVFFTSRFVQAHFSRLYPHLKIPAHVLLSPSPAANKHIGGLGEYKKLLAKKRIKNAYEFRLLKYRELLL
jgi:G:T/U-mismatch repair DNA glycosylase